MVAHTRISTSQWAFVLVKFTHLVRFLNVQGRKAYPLRETQLGNFVMGGDTFT